MALFVSQGKYTRDILKQFNMEGCNTEETPMNVHERLVIDDSTRMADARKFRNLVERLIYLTHTRPDLAYAVGLVSKVYALSKKEKFELVGYCDSDWAIAKDDMKSTIQNCFMFGSGVVTWASKKEATIALSSTEAEYISAATAACQAVRSAVAMTRNPVLHARTKHIDIKHGQLILTISRRDLIEISDLGPRKNLGSKSRCPLFFKTCLEENNTMLRRRFESIKTNKSLDPILLRDVEENDEWTIRTENELQDFVNAGDGLLWSDVREAMGGNVDIRPSTRSKRERYRDEDDGISVGSGLEEEVNSLDDVDSDAEPLDCN
ncbi:retrovirus-related pol polyprotein from transposon TNT 1-94 [Tanacetum coccineum]